MRARTSSDGTRLYYLSPDDRMLTFFFNPLFPPDQLTHYPELVADVDRAVALAHIKVPGAAPVEVYRGGAYPLQWDQRDTTLRDALRSAFWAGLIILCIDLLTVRRPRSTVMVYLSLAAGLVITFGVTYLVIGTVNVITAFLWRSSPGWASTSVTTSRPATTCSWARGFRGRRRFVKPGRKPQCRRRWARSPPWPSW